MKNILIISPTMGKGGMERQLSIFLEHFDRSKYNVTLALVRNKIEYDLPSDIEIINLDKRYKIDLRFYWKIFKLLKDKKWDVIQSKISGLNEQVMFFCGILNKKNLIVEIRSSGEVLNSNYKNMNILINLFKKNHNWQIITNSKKAENELRSFIKNNIKITTIYNAIDTEKFKRMGCIPKNDIVTIGFVGRILKVKNLEILVNAISVITNNVICEIYGHIEDKSYYENLVKLSIEKKIEKKIRFYAPVSDIENIYNRFDLFILPSHYEGTPNVLLEAMSCECVCLISKGANSDYYLNDEFVFDQNNAKELAEKILKVLEKENYIGKVNRQYILDNFSIKNQLKLYNDIFKGCE